VLGLQSCTTISSSLPLFSYTANCMVFPMHKSDHNHFFLLKILQRLPVLLYKHTGPLCYNPRLPPQPHSLPFLHPAVIELNGLHLYSHVLPDFICLLVPLTYSAHLRKYHTDVPCQKPSHCPAVAPWHLVLVLMASGYIQMTCLLAYLLLVSRIQGEEACAHYEELSGVLGQSSGSSIRQSGLGSWFHCL
jgi:hypothetical protein